MRKTKNVNFNVVTDDTLEQTPATCNQDIKKPMMRVKTRIMAGNCFN